MNKYIQYKLQEMCNNTPKPSGNYTSYYRNYRKAYKRKDSIFVRMYCHLIRDYRYLCKSELSYLIQIRRIKDRDLPILVDYIMQEYDIDDKLDYDDKHFIYSAIKWDLTKYECKEFYNYLKSYKH